MNCPDSSQGSGLALKCREIYQKGSVENYIDLDGVDKKWVISLYDKAFEIDPEFVNGL